MNVSVCLLWCKKCLRADLWRASQQVGGAVEQQVGLCVSTISPSIIFHPSPSIWDLEFNRPTKEGALSHLNNTLTPARYPHDMVTHILHTHTLFFWRHCLFNLQLCVCIERERERGSSGEAGHEQSRSRESTCTSEPVDSAASARRGEAGCSNDDKYVMCDEPQRSGCAKETQRWNLWGRRGSPLRSNRNKSEAASQLLPWGAPWARIESAGSTRRGSRAACKRCFVVHSYLGVDDVYFCTLNCVQRTCQRMKEGDGKLRTLCCLVSVVSVSRAALHITYTVKLFFSFLFF